jgi:flagellar hook protein FlgE
MGIQSSLYSGVSGLAANGNAMSVIGNNIANSNTIGFKSSRTLFSDLLSSSVAGSGGPSQIGRGVGLSMVDNIFSQGTFENTESNTDLAIEGPGFFMVRDPNGTTINSGNSCPSCRSTPRRGPCWPRSSRSWGDGAPEPTQRACARRCN